MRKLLLPEAYSLQPHLSLQEQLGYLPQQLSVGGHSALWGNRVTDTTWMYKLVYIASNHRTSHKFSCRRGVSPEVLPVKLHTHQPTNGTMSVAQSVWQQWRAWHLVSFIMFLFSCSKELSLFNLQICASYHPLL